MRGPRPLTPDEVAHWLNVDRSQVIRLARRGDLPHFRIGKCYRLDAETIREYLGIMWGGTSPLLTPEEVSNMFDVPVKTIYTWVLISGIYPKNPAPHIRVGRYVRFHRWGLIDWLSKLPVKRKNELFFKTESTESSGNHR
jgi:excisionase family DNA binding protein